MKSALSEGTFHSPSLDLENSIDSGASTLTHVIAHKMRRQDGWQGVASSIPCFWSDLRRLRAGFGIPVCDDSMGVKATYSRPLTD